MSSYKVILPRDVEVDIFNLPNDFKEIVEKCFKEYTRGTAKEYQFVDKLGFIDLFVRKLNHEVTPEDVVSDLYKQRVQYEWEENGAVIDSEDVYCQDFMFDCARCGMESARLKQHFGAESHHIYDQILKVLVEVITVVINYSE